MFLGLSLGSGPIDPREGQVYPPLRFPMFSSFSIIYFGIENLAKFDTKKVRKVS